MTSQHIYHPSPNHGDRNGQEVDTLVIHYTAMASAEDALQHLCNPRAQVSAHYLIDEDGTVYHLVDESRRAWHAGASCWRGRSDVNSRSIGIELYNPGHNRGYRPFPEKQIAALEALCLGILSRHTIPACNVIGHADIAPTRKQDPGELFPWRLLAKKGIGLWPEKPRLRDAFNAKAIARRPAQLRRLMNAYGFPHRRHGKFRGASFHKTLIAFQRHFEPDVFSSRRKKAGKPTAETVKRLRALNRVARQQRFRP